MQPENRNPALREPEPDASVPDMQPGRPASTLEIACFVESMTAEMRTMAREAELGALAYFLEMARMEASAAVERLARKVEPL